MHPAGLGSCCADVQWGPALHTVCAAAGLSAGLGIMPWQAPARAIRAPWPWLLRLMVGCHLAVCCCTHCPQVLHLVDFEQLKIENQQYFERIDGKNRELLQLKLSTGKTVQVRLGCLCHTVREFATQHAE